MKKIIAIGAAMAATLCVTAQSVSDYAVRRSEYPRIIDNCRAEFKVNAPDARDVKVDIDGKKYDMTKDAEGRWTCVTDSIGPGFQYYFLIVDGMRVSDPSSRTFYGCGVDASGIEIPYAKDDTRFQPKNVPHGEVVSRRYYSDAAGAWKEMKIYLPPCYHKDASKTYPVLYLQHGGGEDQDGWSRQGRTDIMLDNLIAEGKAQPMIIVMSDGNSSDFTKELIEECIPLVESTYRVKTDAGSRALAGLSMGGIQTLNAVIEHPELFRYVGVFSSGWLANSNIDASFAKANTAEKYYSMLGADKDKYNKQFKEFWLSMGGPEDIAYNNCKIMRKRFDDMGINYKYFETPGGHTWPVWRESLYRFSQLLFK